MSELLILCHTSPLCLVMWWITYYNFITKQLLVSILLSHSRTSLSPVTRVTQLLLCITHIILLYTTALILPSILLLIPNPPIHPLFCPSHTSCLSPPSLPRSPILLAFHLYIQFRSTQPAAHASAAHANPIWVQPPGEGCILTMTSPRSPPAL